MQVLDVSPFTSGLAARCFRCRNRFGLVNLVVLDSGLLCCERCLGNREILDVPGRPGSVEMVG